MWWYDGSVLVAVVIVTVLLLLVHFQYDTTMLHAANDAVPFLHQPFVGLDKHARQLSVNNPDQPQLSDIPDIQTNNGSIISYIQQHYPTFQFYDTKKTRQCLSGKKLLFLGDSTMSETVDDLVILLSGMNIDRSKSHPHDTLETYVANVSKASYGPLVNGKYHQSTYLRLSLAGNVTVEFLSSGRRTINVSCSSIDFDSKMRFIGHDNLRKNYLGIATLENESFKKELKCLLGENTSTLSYYNPPNHWSCSPRTHLILNSGLHDVHDWKKLSMNQQNGTDFGTSLRRFLRHLSVNYPSLNVIWKSVMLMPSTMEQLPPLSTFDRYHFSRQIVHDELNSDNVLYPHMINIQHQNNRLTPIPLLFITLCVHRTAYDVMKVLGIPYVNTTIAYGIINQTLPQDTIPTHMSPGGKAPTLLLTTNLTHHVKTLVHNNASIFSTYIHQTFSSHPF